MKIKNILQTFLIICLLSSLIPACSKSSGTTGGGGGGNGGGGGGGGTFTSYNIDINTMSYSPSTATVKVGTVVKWTNTDYYSAHTVTSDNNGNVLNSGNITSGNSYSYTAATAGTYPYHCTIHGTTMAGTLTVTP